MKVFLHSPALGFPLGQHCENIGLKWEQLPAGCGFSYGNTWTQHVLGNLQWSLRTDSFQMRRCFHPGRNPPLLLLYYRGRASCKCSAEILCSNLSTFEFWSTFLGGCDSFSELLKQRTCVHYNQTASVLRKIQQSPSSSVLPHAGTVRVVVSPKTEHQSFPGRNSVSLVIYTTKRKYRGVLSGGGTCSCSCSVPRLLPGAVLNWRHLNPHFPALKYSQKSFEQHVAHRLKDTVGNLEAKLQLLNVGKVLSLG